MAEVTRSLRLTITVNVVEFPEIDPVPEFRLRPGASASHQLVGTKGLPPYRFSGVDLPPWATVTPDGLLSITAPDAAGSYQLTVEINDAMG